VLRFLVRFNPSDLPREEFLASVRGVAKAAGSEARNPKWTSYGALEMDIFSPTRQDFGLFLAAVNPIGTMEFTKDLNVAPPFKTENDLFAEARQLFNSERYWESHEVLEGIWRQKHGDEKRFLQGIILVCAAYVHHQKGEQSVALSVLKRASKQLDYPATSYGGFNVDVLRQKAEEVLRTERFVNFQV
jgi:uncharacterized protein